MAEITIRGLSEVQAKLAQTPSILVAKLFHKALDRAIGVIAAEVEARVPVGEHEELAENIITPVEIDLIRKGGSAAVGFSHNESESGYPIDLIAMWLEYGHRIVTHDGREVGQVAPHPFMRTAAVASAERAAEVFAQVLIDGLEQIGTL